MNPNPEQKATVSLIGALLGLGLLATISLYHASRSADTLKEIERIRERRWALTQLRTGTLQALACSQNYVITQDPRQLKSYAAFLQHTRETALLLRDTPADAAEQPVQLAAFSAGFDQFAAALTQDHALRQTHGLEAASLAIKSDRRQEALHRLLKLLLIMEETENTVLADYQTSFALTEHYTVTLIIAGVVFAAMVMIGGWFLVRRDAHLRQRTEQELLDFFRVSLDPLSVIDAEGRFQRLNGAWKEVLGYETEAMIGQPFVNFVHPDDLAATHAEARKLADGNDTVDFENRYRTVTGEWRWLQWSATVSRSTGLLYGAARDITQRKANEAQIAQLNTGLQLQNTRLQEANSELDAFSYSVSHDLRAPLRHINGFANLLTTRATVRLDDTDRRYLDTIIKSAQRMGLLIEDLLVFSRMSRAAMKVAPVSHDKLITEIIHDLGFDDVPNIAWYIDPLPVAPGDGPMLRQVWLNLIDNAVKYSGRNPHPRIEIGARIDPTVGEAVYHVRDNGVGFSMQYAAKLFGVFQRLHSETDFAGTGIGLANVRRIVSRHGGRTWAEGCVGEGATFYFSVPLNPLPAAT